jgi:hypothetical protein
VAQKSQKWLLKNVCRKGKRALKMAKKMCVEKEKSQNIAQKMCVEKEKIEQKGKKIKTCSPFSTFENPF